jgi:predicted AlkP superfamily pyrophosphatase or phosphodiesterase
MAAAMHWAMRFSLFAAAATAVTATIAAPAAAQPAGPPRLIVAISVDQLSSDLFEAYRPHFSGGFRRLADGGVTFVNGFQAHAATETCPGHSTLLTGRWPAANGIVANQWIDQRAQREDKTIYCAEDPRAPGSNSREYQVSPHHLRSSTLGDRLKAVDARSRNVAVAGKDRAAVMMSGRMADQRWYWDGKGWSTDLRQAPVPRSVAAFRTAFAAQLGQPRPDLEVPALCQARARRFEVTPTVSVGTGRLGRAAGDARAMRASPELDGGTLALAFALTRELNLGRGPATDVLSVGLSATDYVGHSFGWGGQEMCLQMLALDRELGDFLARLDQTNVPYAVVLSSDHGGEDLVERRRVTGKPLAQRADPNLDAEEMSKRLAALAGGRGPLLRGTGIGGDVWLRADLLGEARAKVLASAAALYRAHPQVEAVFTADELVRTPLPRSSPDRWTLIERVRATFDPSRSGDFYVVLKEHVSPVARPSNGYTVTHGTPWDHDRRVPILFWATGLKPATPSTAADTADILPTLASWLNLPVAPGTVDGRCRTEAARCR